MRAGYWIWISLGLGNLFMLGNSSAGATPFLRHGGEALLACNFALGVSFYGDDCRIGLKWWWVMLRYLG